MGPDRRALFRNPADFVRAAWDAGASIWLDGIVFGRILWGNERDVVTDSSNWPYYRFLAGVAKAIEANSALEVGTHWGGSARSISRGLKRGKVVTIDVTTESDAVLPTCSDNRLIQKIVGDAASVEVISQVRAALSSADLLYVDDNHLGLPATGEPWACFQSA